MKSFDEIVKRLPPELRREAIDFAEFLLQKKIKAKKPLRLSWAGALKQFRGQYTSLDCRERPWSGGAIKCS